MDTVAGVRVAKSPAELGAAVFPAVQSVSVIPSGLTATSDDVPVDDAEPVLIVALNANRKGLLIYNNSTENLDLSLSDTDVPATAFTRLGPNETFRLDSLLLFTNAIYGIWDDDDATGFARVTEFS